MQPRFVHNLALVTVLALLLHPWMAWSGEEPAGATGTALPEKAATQATADSAATKEEMRELKAHYRQDPTGVRARLGMCRRGESGGHPGRHRRFHGGCQRCTMP